MEAPPRRSRCGSNEHETLAVVWLASAGGVLAAAWVRTGGCPRRSARQADGGRRDAVPRRLVVAPLLDAAGVRNAEPKLFVLPHDARLAGIQCAYPGELGMLEERPTEGPDGEPTVAGAVDLANTKKLFEHLERSPRNRVDSRAFLAARLMDVLIGDWDRHQDQWRWARFDSAGVRWWRPLPRDRDQAFPRLDGMLIWLTGFYPPQVVGFGDDYPGIWRLTFAGQVPDRRLLVDLEKPVWDSVAKAIQAKLTDSVIDTAVRRLPPEYYAKSGAALAHALRRRR